MMEETEAYCRLEYIDVVGTHAATRVCANAEFQSIDVDVIVIQRCHSQPLYVYYSKLWGFPTVDRAIGEIERLFCVKKSFPVARKKRNPPANCIRLWIFSLFFSLSLSLFYFTIYFTNDSNCPQACIACLTLLSETHRKYCSSLI